jgi:hypothetical protein
MSWLRRLGRYFVAGVLAILPLVITVGVVVWVADFLNRFLGPNTGIGRAVAVLFAREGADVAIVYLNEDTDAEETCRAVEAEGQRALLIPGDVTDPEFCRQAVETTVHELDQLDILVNNAAFQEHVPSLEELSDEQLERTFKTNIFGYFYMARAALPHLREGSAIINTGSVTGIEGEAALIERARANARANGISNADFHVGDLSRPPDRTLSWMRGRYDAVLLDPPRVGAREVLSAVAHLTPRRVVYISCHTGSLARDLGILTRDHGYRLRAAGVLDMFPHTTHVESMAVLEKGA